MTISPGVQAVQMTMARMVVRTTAARAATDRHRLGEAEVLRTDRGPVQNLKARLHGRAFFV